MAATAPRYASRLEGLGTIVERRYALTSPATTRRYRTGFRFRTGPALAVVRPGNLIERWRVLKACAPINPWQEGRRTY